MMDLAPRNRRAIVPTTWTMDVVGPSRIDTVDAGFPVRLAGVKPRAKALWLRGVAPADGQPSVAIVGARAASRAGCDRAFELARGMAAAGRQVVSGGALGIDAAAHRGALAGGGATFAVLGCGVDVVYPDRHAALFADVAATGGLLSEYEPGTQPRIGQFPARNRIIAALAEAVLVVEAGFASG